MPRPANCHLYWLTTFCSHPLPTSSISIQYMYVCHIRKIWISKMDCGFSQSHQTDTSLASQGRLQPHPHFAFFMVCISIVQCCTADHKGIIWCAFVSQYARWLLRDSHSCLSPHRCLLEICWTELGQIWYSPECHWRPTQIHFLLLPVW
jgi:hypothetical protein